MNKYFLLILACIWCSYKTHGQVLFSSMPLDGVNGSSFFIVNNVDHDTSAGLSNYACGDKTYNGHQGTDFLIRSFKTMDSGVNVKAVAAGRVFFVSDTQYDRNKRINPYGFGNYIAINHQNTLYTYYAHIKKNSALVRVGDSVSAGQVLAKVGCSGNCTDPHVHLEVYDNASNLIDPFSGTCQTTSASFWATQPTYDTTLKIIDKGFTPYVPNLDTLRERYAVRDTFYYGIDTTVNFWIEAQGIRRSDSEKFEWFTPSGAYWFGYASRSPQNWWYYYNWSYINTPDSAGLWTAKYYVNNILTATKVFYVVKSTDVPAVSSFTNKCTVSPNPTNGDVYINGTLLAKQPIVVVDITGKPVAEFEARTHHLDLSGLPKGMYLIRCGAWVEKLIKQ